MRKFTSNNIFIRFKGTKWGIEGREEKMKKMKKLASLLLALVMVFAMTTTAFAAEETGSITIKDAVSGQTYTIYQILDLSYSYVSSETTDGEVVKTAEAYTYTATEDWDAFVNDAKIKGVYLDVDAQGYVTWHEDADVKKFAELAQAYAAKNLTDNQGSVIATSETVAFTGLDLGYYLVDTTLGTICSLDTTNPDVEMEEKNEEPTAVKEVQEDSDESWGASNDADINQTVKFQAKIIVQAGAENYVLYDKMSDGLTYTGVTSVQIEGVDVEAANYTVTAPARYWTCTSEDSDHIHENACYIEYTFAVEFKNGYTNSLKAGTEIVISYEAVLNESAKVGLEGNPNEITLKYGDENHPTFTPPSKTITYTWDMEIIKYTTVDGKEVKLPDATFKLSTDKDGENVIKFHSLGENKYQVCVKEEADSTKSDDENKGKCNESHVTTITTDKTGTFKIEGIDEGTYYLIETAAPAGYNKLKDPVEVVITGAVENEDETLEYTTLQKMVENNTGTELPSTGGIGTTLFYIIGATLVLGAAVVLVTRKRMSVEE